MSQKCHERTHGAGWIFVAWDSHPATGVESPSAVQADPPPSRLSAFWCSRKMIAFTPIQGRLGNFG